MFKIRAMEPNMVVEMLKSIKEKKAIVTTLTGDDGSTAFNRARVEVCPSLEKLMYHIKLCEKNLTSNLYKSKPLKLAPFHVIFSFYFTFPPKIIDFAPISFEARFKVYVFGVGWGCYNYICGVLAS